MLGLFQWSAPLCQFYVSGNANFSSSSSEGKYTERAKCIGRGLVMMGMSGSGIDPDCNQGDDEDAEYYGPMLHAQQVLKENCDQ